MEERAVILLAAEILGHISKARNVNRYKSDGILRIETWNMRL